MRIGRMFIVVSGLAMSVVLAGPAAGGECPNAGHAGVVECPTDPTDPGPTDPGPTVSGTQVVAGDPAVPEAQVLGVSLSRGGGGAAGLPVTGSDVVPLVVLGASAAGVGAILVTSSRRRRSEA